ncbi:MAG: 2OG-Fe(II) oxygenase [Bacteroidota bacterium]
MSDQPSETQWTTWMDQLAEQEYLMVDDFLPPALFAAVLQAFERRLNAEGFTAAGIGSQGDHQVNQQIRGDWVHWLDEGKDADMAGFFQHLDTWRGMLNRYCYLGLSDFECHFAHYPAGTFYHRHLDQFKGRNNRMISTVFYLNQEWQERDGGHLILYQAETTRIQPKGNRMVLFQSAAVEHEVALTHKSRYSLTGWFLRQPKGLGMY